MKIGILTTLYITSPLQFELAYDSLESLKKSNTDAEIVNMGIVNKCDAHYVQELDKFYDILITNPEGNNLSASWNFGITTLLNLGCEYVVVPNLDILVAPDCIQNLVYFAQRNPECVLWTATHIEKENLGKMPKEESTHSPDFSFFIVDKSLFDQVGQFDQQFFAYHGDNDMSRRASLANLKMCSTNYARYWHYGSVSMKGAHDPKEAEETLGSMVSRPLYVAKHGGEADKETFIYPYNNRNNSWQIYY